MKPLVALLLSLFPIALPASAQDPYQAIVAGWPFICRFEPLIPAADIGPGKATVDGAATVAAAPGGRVFAAMAFDADGRGVHVEEIGVDGSHAVISQTLP